MSTNVQSHGLVTTSSVDDEWVTHEFVYQPPIEPLQVLYQDKDLLILNKPSGLLTNPGRGAHLADCLLQRVQQEYPTALLVNRLDLATSGLVVMALRKKAEAALKQQFADRTVKKLYLARVWQQPAEPKGTLQYPLLADPAAPPRNKVCWQHGKAATTFYRCLPEQPSQPHALVALTPLTGRAHQLRVHLQQLGHPILGDQLYAPAAAVKAAPRLLLHATKLALYQPYSGQQLCFFAPPDAAVFGINSQTNLSELSFECD